MSLARERTVLAWQRTGLAYVGCGALLLKTVPATVIPHGRTVVGSGFVAIGVLAVAFGFLQRRVRGPRALRAMSLSMTALAAVATVVALLPKN